MSAWYLLFVTFVCVVSQDQDSSEDLGERLGLLGPSLGLSPTGEVVDTKNTDEEDNAPLIALDNPFDNIPDEMIIPEEKDVNETVVVSVENFENENNESTSSVFNFNNPVVVQSDKLTGVIAASSVSTTIPPEPKTPAPSSQCCCVPDQESCPDPLGGTDLVNSGLIDDRLEKKAEQTVDTSNSLTFRIALADVTSSPTCPLGMKACCYQEDLNLETFGISCLTPEKALSADQWKQGCLEREEPAGAKQCGTRSSRRPAEGLNAEEASPGEFPWTCMILTKENGFVGNCAIIPGAGANTRKVITAAHKLNKITNSSELKVRVGEYDASGFRQPETVNFQEYPVESIVKHPQFSAKRLSHDLAVLVMAQAIDLSLPHVNSACLPSCKDQFSHQFSNGTGVSCWVSGWGRDQVSGAFQPVQHKMNLPLVEQNKCESALRVALNARKPGVGDQFVLSPSEVCAGGDNQDACTGDGGSPLVCQASSGRWTVVGLVTWGVGCAEQLPGVYVRVNQFREWIDNNNDDIINNVVENEVAIDERNVPRTLGDKNKVGSIRFV
eukprot:GFUD01009926.1.p1 GENE.GFUD01009926.1~~GFUD01009926.1.p1  ORF type:complete len:607 (-),score=161.60 GFUD01009926.1:18-1679(-)